MASHRTPIRTLAALAAASMLALASCSADPGDTATDPTDSATDAAESESEQPAATFRYVMQQAVTTIDPAKVVNSETDMLTIVNTYDPLFYPDVANESMSPVPFVADTYEVSDDGLTYTIAVRDGIAFQSGNQLTAEDVAYSMVRALQLGQGPASTWAGVLAPEDVVAVDNSTVEFTLSSPFAPFISTLTQLFILDSAVVQENYVDGDFGEHGDYGQEFLTTQTAGSGPYIIDTFDPQAEITLSAFDGYWRGWDDNQISDVALTVVTEEATVKTMLQSGQAQMINKTLTVSAYEEFATNPDLVVESVDSARIQYLPLNTQISPTDDIKVREAIANAIDYETALDVILGGAKAAAGPVPAIIPGHNASIVPVTQDLDRARELLSESQYSGDELAVNLVYVADIASQRQLVQLVESNLEEIGISVTLEPLTWAQITEQATSVDATANLTVITTAMAYPHVDSFLFGMYDPASAGSTNSMSWLESSEVGDLITAARAETDETAQEELYGQVQELVVEQYPAVYLANTTSRIAYTADVEGYVNVGLLGFDLAFYDLSYVE